MPIMSRGSLLVASFVMVTVTVCAFGLLSYYKLNQRYINSQALNDQILMKYDNSVTKIRALEAEKNRRDETVRRDEERYRELFEDYNGMKQQFSSDKKALLNKITSLESQLKKSENDYRTISDGCSSCRKDFETCSTEFESFKSESAVVLSQQKQECANNINRVKDEISAIKQSSSQVSSSPKVEQKRSGNVAQQKELLNDASKNQIPEPVMKTKKNVAEVLEHQDDAGLGLVFGGLETNSDTRNSDFIPDRRQKFKK